MYCRAINYESLPFELQDVDFFTSVLAVLIADLHTHIEQSFLLGLLQGTLDQSLLLSNLCLSILAMLTFLSKFYEERMGQTFDWWIIQVISSF